MHRKGDGQCCPDRGHRGRRCAYGLLLLLALLVPASGDTCLHGSIVDGVCECDPYYSGVDCSLACPGLLTHDCSDEGCSGASASACGEDCQFRTSDSTCLGIRSCVAEVCSGRGECVWGRSGSGECTNCEDGYYGADCGTRCTTELCYERYGMAGLQCNPSDGSCECPNDDEAGHFASVETLCRTCADGWYGASCDQACECSGHGSCAQMTGACACYDDDEYGHWVGKDCSSCSDYYLGETCTERNVLLTSLSNASVTLSTPGAVSALRQAARTTMGVSVSAGRLVASRGSAVVCGTITSESSVSSSSSSTTIFDGMVVWDTAVSTSGDIHLLLIDDAVVGEWHVLVARLVGTGKGSKACDFEVVSDTAVDPAGRSEDEAASSSPPPLPTETRGTLSSQPVVVIGAAFISSSSLDWVFVTNGGSVFVNGSDVTATIPWAAAAASSRNDDTQLSSHLSAVRVQPITWLRHDGSQSTEQVVLMAGADKGSSPAWRAFYMRLGEGGASGATSVAGIAIDAPISPQYTQVQDILVVNGTHLALALLAANSEEDQGALEATTVGVVVLSQDGQGGFTVASQLEVPLHGVPSTVTLSWYATYGLIHLVAPSSGLDETIIAGISFGTRNESTGDSTMLSLVTYQRLRHESNATDAALVAVEDWSLLYLALWESAKSAFYLAAYTTYAVQSTSPTTVIRAGGAPITVLGAYFPRLVRCVFEGTIFVIGEYINASAITCATPAFFGRHACQGTSLSVTTGSTPFPAPAQSRVLVRHYAVPLIKSATAANGAYTSVNGQRPIHVYGQGFADVAHGMVCRFEDAAGMNVRTRATFASSESIYCSMPDNITRPTRGTTGTVSVSYDGAAFSNKVSFTFVGEAKLLQVAGSAHVAVRAAALVGLPSLVVEVADAEGHALRELDDDKYHNENTTSARVVVVGPVWFNSTRKEVANQIDPFSSLIVFAYSNKTREGATSFTAYLQSPRVGVGLLEFTSAGLSPAHVTYTVREGVPRKLAITVAPPTSIDNVQPTHGRQPVISLLDDSDNVVSNYSEIKDIVVVATFFNGTGRPQISAQPASGGYVPFYNLFQQGLFGQRYGVSFAASNLSSVTTSVAATVESCVPTKYGQYGSTECHSCPRHAVCNGSYAFNVTPGFWKASEFAYTVHPCPSPRVCLGDSCQHGYTGALCSECAAGFGKTVNLCVRCFSVAANIVLLILLIVAVLVLGFVVVVVMFQALSQYTDAMNVLCMLCDYWQMAGLVVAPLPEMPAFTERFAAALRIFSRCDVIQLSPLSCLKSDAYTDFLIAVVAPPVICVVVQGVLLYTHRSYRRYLRQKEREHRFNRSLAPFRSQEEYFARVAQLGLDEEPTLSTGAPATLEDLQLQKQRIREAYALLDKNSHAVATISQMPPSKPRDYSLKALFREQDGLHDFIERYEAQVSKVAGPAGGAVADPHGGTSDGPPGSDLSSSFASSVSSTPATANLPRNAATTNARRRQRNAPSPSPPLPPQLQEQQGLPRAQKHAPPAARPASSTSSEGGGGPAEEATAPSGRGARGGGFEPRFPPITETRLTLFGGNEPAFQPIHADLDAVTHRLATLKEPVAAPLPRRLPFYFQWPSTRQHLLEPPLIILGYLYATIIFYCFSLVPCTTIDLGVTESPSTRRVLRADTTLDCDAAKHRSYRVAGITMGSLVGAGFPVLILIYRVAVSRSKTVAGRESFRQMVELIHGLRMPCMWWELVPHLLKFTTVVLFVLLPSPHLASFVIFWTLVLLLAATLWVAPYQSRPTHVMACFGIVGLLLLISVQMLPYAYHPDTAALHTSATINTVGGVLVIVVVVVVSIAFLTVSGALLFASPRQLDELAQRWRTAVRYVMCGALAPCSPGAVASAAWTRLPFSFEWANTAIVNMETERAMKHKARRKEHAAINGTTEGEPASGSDTDDAETRARPARTMQFRSGAQGLLPSAFHAGRLATVRTIDLLLDFVENNAVQLDRRPRSTEAAASMRDMEREVLEAHSVAVEHAQQLDRLIQLFKKSLERQNEHQ